MRSFNARVLAALLFGVALCFGSTLAARADSDVIVLETGSSTIVDAPGLTRVATGDATIAGVVPLGTGQVVINAKAPGRTTVYVWASYGGVTKYQVYVSGQVPNDLAKMIRAALNVPNVQVVSFRNAVVVRGTVKDQAVSDYVDSVLSRFTALAKAQNQTLVNALYVPHPLGAIEEELAHIPGASNIHLDYDQSTAGAGNIIVSGEVRDRQQAEMVMDKARGLAGRFLATNAKVIDRLAVDLTSQVDVKVYVLEMDNSGLSQLGVNFQGGQPNPSNPAEILPVPPSFPIIENGNAGHPGKAFTIGAFFRNVFLMPTLDLVLESGHGRILSSPDLVTLPGEEAKFLVGGQIPYTYSSGFGSVSVQFQQYGVQLDVTPTILGNGKIETKIAPTVSDLDYTNAVSLNGTTVPGLKISQLSTDVITSEGEGIVMGGLLRHLQQKEIFKVPGLSAIPILGALFQSVHYTNNETNVVFVMLPTVINQ
ncbi:MAG: pilus assembly protein N-terminal domain-containing protein [Candidatus Eremiobacteraeota bacterium]|nr:pilus assembly protein N-terminal domain-containing protein [Candidatus Eremiobacteraeota bacterium]